MLRNCRAPFVGRFPKRPAPASPLRTSFQSPPSRSSSQTSRIDRITARLPRRLQKYTAGLRDAPVSHVVSFLILHELTAIVPLFALFGVFHYTNFVPVSYVTTNFGSYVETGTGRFERYFRRKGWFGFSREDQDVDTSGGEDVAVMEKWESGDPKYKTLVEVAMAYAITKAFLPVRIVGSVWATPWFAGVLARLRTSFSGKR